MSNPNGMDKVNMSLGNYLRLLLYEMLNLNN